MIEIRSCKRIGAGDCLSQVRRDARILRHPEGIPAPLCIGPR
jgi:hypothetical protein